MAPLMSRQECLKAIFINSFCDFFLCLCNNWNILTILDPFWYWRSQISNRNGHGKNEILQHVLNNSKKDICNHIDVTGLESRDRRHDGQHSSPDGASLLLLINFFKIIVLPGFANRAKSEEEERTLSESDSVVLWTRQYFRPN